MRPGQSFENADVAECYRLRPEYPPEIYRMLAELAPQNQRLLDIGCGTGKIARGLSGSFESIVALDASASMLQVAKSLQDRRNDNIEWIHGLGESAEIGLEPFDLVVAAASVHWMDHSQLFPRLRDRARADHVFAVVEGDGAHDPPWQKPWDDFLARWILTLKGEAYEPDREDSDFERYMTRYRKWVDLAGESSAEFCVSQSISDFILCQHSRDTFAPSRMRATIGEFDEELRLILEPHAVEDVLTYSVRTRIEWGSIKSV